MANISVELMTIEPTNSGTPHGHYEVKVFASLNEAPEEILADALKRVQTALQSIPPEKRYQKMPLMDC